MHRHRLSKKSAIRFAMLDADDLALLVTRVRPSARRQAERNYRTTVVFLNGGQHHRSFDFGNVKRFPLKKRAVSRRDRPGGLIS